MFPAAGPLLPLVAIVSSAHAATPLVFEVVDPTGATANYTLEPPFSEVIEANLGKEVHRLTLTATDTGDLTADLVTIRKGKETPARSIQKSPPTAGNSMSFSLVWPSHKSSTLKGAAASWKFQVTATEMDQSGRSGKIRRDWETVPHPEHKLAHARAKPGARLFATVDDTKPAAVWPDGVPDMAAEIVEQKGGKVKLRRVGNRAVCAWPPIDPQVQLEGWVELADLGRMLSQDSLTVYGDGTALWLYAGAPLERVGSDHKVKHLGLTIPSTAAVDDRFVPTLTPEAGESRGHLAPKDVAIDGTRLDAVPMVLPVVDTSPDGGLSEVILPFQCGRAVVASAPPKDARSTTVGGPLTMPDKKNAEAVPNNVHGTLTWPDGQPAGQLVPTGDGKGSVYFYRVKKQKDGRKCGVWHPTNGPTSDTTGIPLCWTITPPPPAEPTEP